MKFYFYIFLSNFFFSATFCCEQHKTCRECIRDENKCVWCADEKYKEGIRCKSEVGPSDWCSGHIKNPSPKLEVKPPDEFSSEKGGIVQLKPQEIKLNLRPGQAIDFDFTYKRAKNYPLDFYFLMDGSRSMHNYMQRTANQSMAMYNMLYKMTDDIFVGMGTFVDKNAIPYTDNVVKNVAYSFKNLLKLNNNYTEFQSALGNMKFGENVDEPEGIMDALAQVMACKEEIGWRNQSRKIIVLNTDASYHVAGHGIWAGIIQPYDGNCYTEDGIYTKELEMDYPSISILKTMALREGFVIIFVVKLGVKEVYKPLIEEMGAYVTDYGGKDEKNINEILSDIYNNIAESIRLTNQIDSSYKDYFEITFKPDCNKEDCLVNINEEKKFMGTIKLLKYLDAENIPINVAIDGLNEKLRLDVNIIKECECEPEFKSSFCSLNGNKTCGICECDPGWHGESCQCSAVGDLDIDKMHCMANSTECNNRGYCMCGKCKCEDNFKGKFCECNLQNCMRGSNGNLCSGHGNCGEIKCGQCRCEDDWTGDDCSCSKLQTNCKEDGKEICSGFGDCECNKCTCKPPAPWDIRSRDHLCRPVQSDSADEGQQLQCVQLQACVLKFLNDRKSGCKHVNFTAVDTLEINNSVEETLVPENIIDNITNNIEESIEQDKVVESQEQHVMAVKTQELSNTFWIECPEIRADVGCYAKFVYKYDDNTYGIDIKVQTKLNCAETYYWAGGGCLIGLILIGLVTLVCWKILTNRRDRAEYDRFLNEVESENPELINPIFAPATISFNNPAFRRPRPES